MSLLFRPACSRHRARLIELVDRRAAPGADEALAHLERCERCRTELTELALSIAALRRLGREVRAVEPPPAVWGRIRARIDVSPVPAWFRRAPLATSLVASAIVAAILAPSAIYSAGPAQHLEEAGTDPSAIAQDAAQAARESRALEIRFVTTRLPGPSSPGPWQGPRPQVDPDRGHEVSDATVSGIVIRRR